MPIFNRGKRLKSLEKRREELIEEFEVINEQLSSTLSAADELRLKRRLKQVNKEIEEVNAEIELLRSKDPPQPQPSPPPRPLNLGLTIAIFLIIVCGVLSIPWGRNLYGNLWPTATEPAEAVLAPLGTLTATITETATATPPACGTPHPNLPGTGISGSVTVTYTQSSNLSGCIVFREERPQFQVSWTDAPVGTELWLLVYSPQTQQYFPHYCASIQVSRGGQMCQATLLREQPYEIVFVLANASAHAFLQANSSIDANNLPHGIGIEEKFSIQLVRTQ